GLCCPAGSSLTTASSVLLVRSRRLMPLLSALGLCLSAAARSSPFYSACPSSRADSYTTAVRRRMAVRVAARVGLRLVRKGSASASSTQKTVHAWLRFRGCRVRIKLRPGKLLALHRQGLVHSSFRSGSRLPETSNMTTRAYSQFPRPDFHRLDKQP